jgi:hypothetical protein
MQNREIFFLGVTINFSKFLAESHQSKKYFPLLHVCTSFETLGVHVNFHWNYLRTLLRVCTGFEFLGVDANFLQTFPGRRILCMCMRFKLFGVNVNFRRLFTGQFVKIFAPISAHTQ